MDKSTPSAFLYDERPAAVAGQEDDSEAAWEQFQRLVSHPAHDLEPPVPAKPPVRVPVHTADSVIALAKRGRRICPQPAQWLELFEAMAAARAPQAVLPPLPPVGAQTWSSTSTLAKQMCLHAHIEWAAQNGLLALVADFLEALPETQWHHTARDHAPLPADPRSLN